MTEDTFLKWEVKLPASVISVAATSSLSMILAGCVNRVGYALDYNGLILWSYPMDHEVWAATCTTDGSFVAFGTADKKPAQGKVHILNRLGHPLQTFSIGMPVWGLEFDSQGTKLVVATWGNECRVYELAKRQWRLSRCVKVPGAGLYGIRWRSDGKIVVVSYGGAVCVIDENGNTVQVPASTIGYNLAIDSSDNLVAGARDGGLVLSSGMEARRIEVPKASRAIVGVSVTQDSSVVLAGGFDGYLRAISKDGKLYWERDLVGEVWSTFITPSGAHGLAATGDGRIVAITNPISIDVASELSSYIKDLESETPLGDISDTYRAFIDLSSRVGAYGYALRFLAEQRDRLRLDVEAYSALLEYLGEKCPPDVRDAPDIYFERALQRRLQERHWDAAVMFLKAARKEGLHLRAYTEAAIEFKKADHQAAALACFRRAREAVLTAEDLNLIYTLARSFEDLSQRRIARDHLDIILTHNPDYRDVASRLANVRGAIPFDRETRVDYTGLTVNLLGPDAPTTGVDQKLSHIISSRSKEINTKELERASYDSIMRQLEACGLLSPRANISAVGYDTRSYVKYDFLLPEDDVKKHLEAINLVGILRQVTDVRKTLDVGSATGRYPGIMKALGFESYGVDIEPLAVEYAKSKFPGEQGPYFVQGDVRTLSFEDDYFDFVSCMMGTFYHVPLADQKLALSEMHRVCRQDGVVAVSTWDLECPHQTFLSMYSVNEEQLIQENSSTIPVMTGLFEDTGFLDVGAVRLCLVPDTISYDLGVEDLDINGIRRLVEIDMAARAANPEKHGQMFIAYGRVNKK